MSLYITWIQSAVLLFTAFFLIIKAFKMRSIKRISTRLSHQVNTLYREIEMLSAEKNNYHDRVIELENMKGDAFQVKLRNEIKEVKVDFTKIEIVTILAGVNILLERTKNPEDAKVYINLMEKINSFINDMKE